jgi:FkbM family methyltransferase
MLIPLTQLVQKYGLRLRGVLHVGAHTCEEADAYRQQGVKDQDVIWLEANDSLVKQQRARGHNVHQIVASDTDGEIIDFRVSNNGASSSILELGVHKIYHPSIHYVRSEKLKTKRIATLAQEQGWDMSRLNFLNLDIQGAELKALKGMESLLKHFDAVYTEVNTDEVYVGCAKLHELDQFLNTHGFKRVEISMTDAKWGDALYIKSHDPSPLTQGAPAAVTASANAMSGHDSSERLLLQVGAGGAGSTAAWSSFSRVILVEPSGSVAQAFKGRDDRVKVVCALATDEATPVFHNCSIDTLSSASMTWIKSSRFSDKGADWKAGAPVETTTLDRLVGEHGSPVQTRLDLRGYERHAVQSLSKHIGPLCFAWVEELQDDAARTLYHLLKLGYTRFHIQRGDQPGYHPPSVDSFLTADATVADLNRWTPNRRDAYGFIHCI